MYHLEDFEPNQTFDLGSVTVTKEDIIDFAEKFDPQDFHLDEEKATKMFGGLIASGLHSISLLSKLTVEAILKNAAGMGSPGLDEIRFLHPVFAGDTLKGKLTVLSVKRSKSKPDRGVVKVFSELTNADNVKVMSMKGILILRCREVAGVSQ